MTRPTAHPRCYRRRNKLEGRGVAQQHVAEIAGLECAEPDEPDETERCADRPASALLDESIYEINDSACMRLARNRQSAVPITMRPVAHQDDLAEIRLSVEKSRSPACRTSMSRLRYARLMPVAGRHLAASGAQV